MRVHAPVVAGCLVVAATSTADNILAVCDDCRPSKGLVVIDNVAFEK